MSQRVEEFVGQRVRDHREQLGITQEELGRRLEPLLGKPWPRQAVWAAEQGKRAFTAAELVALASVLDTQPARLVTPPLTVDEVEMPSGETLPASSLTPPAKMPFSEVAILAAKAVQTAQEAQEDSERALAVASRLAEYIEGYSA